MGAEVSYRALPAFSPAAAGLEHKSRIMEDVDEHDSCSLTASDETVDDTTSTASHENCRCEQDFDLNSNDESSNHTDENGTKEHKSIIKKQQKQQRTKLFHRIRAISCGFLFQTNTFTCALIPLMAILLAHTFFAQPFFPLSREASDPLATTVVGSHSSTIVKRFCHWYVQVLKDYPVLTKSLTTGVIQFLGDFGAQRYEQDQQKQQQAFTPEGEEIKKKEQNVKNYDVRRSFSLFVDGIFLSGPLLHYCFAFMEETWPTSSEANNESGNVLSRALATLCHVFLNDYFIDSIYIVFSFIFTGLIEGYSWEGCKENIRNNLWVTIRASWLTSLGLFPIEVFCFGYLSLSFRVLAMNFVDLLWGAIVSFYSHQNRREKHWETHRQPVAAK